MKKALVAAMLVLSSTAAIARDDINDYSVAEAMATPKIATAIGEGVRFYFGQQSHPKVVKTLGQFRTNKKTNAFRKTDEEACQWAFASAMLSLKQRAIAEGGNAVVNIRSNYRDNLTTSDTTFKCGAGGVVAGVALVGDVVTLAQ